MLTIRLMALAPEKIRKGDEMSSWWVSEEKVPVELPECRCPGTPHPKGDTIFLRAELSPAAALAASGAVQEGTSETLTESLGRVYVEHGIVGWTFLDEKGDPVPVSRDLIRKMKWEALYPVANRASLLYSEDFLRPLGLGKSISSRRSQTRGSTSRKSRSSSRSRKR